MIIGFDEFEKLHKLIINDYSEGKGFSSWKLAQRIVIQKMSELCSIHDFSKDEDVLFKIMFYKRIIDSMAWIKLDREPADIRRFFGDEVHITNLSNHNIESHVAYADEFNKVEDTFALITDLGTSLVLGDILIMKDFSNLILPVEVKTGKINQFLLETIQKKLEGNSRQYEQALLDPRLKKQLIRIEKQHKKHQNVMKLYLENESPNEEMPKKIFLVDMDVEHFDNLIETCIKELGEKKINVVTIHGGVSIICFNLKKDIDVHEELSKVFEVKTDSTIIFSFFSSESKNDPQTCPILALDIDLDSKYKLISEEVSVLITFDLQEFCRAFSDSENIFSLEKDAKPIMNINEKMTIPLKDYNIVHSDPDGFRTYLGRGMFQRIFGFLYSPYSMAEQMKLLAKEYKNWNFPANT